MCQKVIVTFYFDLYDRVLVLEILVRDTFYYATKFLHANVIMGQSHYLLSFRQTLYEQDNVIESFEYIIIVINKLAN